VLKLAAGSTTQVVLPFEPPALTMQALSPWAPKVLKLSAERSAGVRKLFRLVQLEQVAERIV
jgi:hypothetical protein